MLPGLDDLTLDVPQAPSHLAAICAALIKDKLITLRDIFQPDNLQVTASFCANVLTSLRALVGDAR